MLKLVGELVGFLAVTTGFVMFQQKRKKNVLVLKIVCDVLWSTHFLLLGAFSGMAISLVGCLRDTTFLLTGGDKSKRRALWLLAFLSINVTCVCLTWKSVWSVCSLISGILSTIAFWSDSPTRTKIISLVVCCSQITYAIAVGSLAAVFNETIAVISIVLFFVRIKKAQKPKMTDKI
ncbi:MAG: YgjV family protein [Clostridia bacterium]|nr:YgjV family protein [Clostridia bacterium]MBQ8716489.1 YgjV family protein [Clostridia bacterium]